METIPAPRCGSCKATSPKMPPDNDAGSSSRVARHWLAPWHKLGRKIAMDEDWLRYGVTAVAPATSAG